MFYLNSTSTLYLNSISTFNLNFILTFYLNLTSRANVASVKIITFMVFILIGCALCFMGLELDLSIVWNCVKVPFSNLEMIYEEKKLYGTLIFVGFDKKRLA